MLLIDQYSVSTIPIEMFFASTYLSLGTGFIWKSENSFFLITNWHNVTGKNPVTGKHLSDTLAEPDRTRVWWNIRDQLGSKKGYEYLLRDAENKPLWWVHPALGHQVDVVALPVIPPTDAEPYPITDMEGDDLSIRVGMDVYVLGYPFGITQGGFPVWKRGSIATEPSLAGIASEKHMLIDTASRPGMSGSPVIRRSWGTHFHEDGSTGIGKETATKFVGVYSGRLAAKDPLDAHLGIAWPGRLVDEIITGRMRDPSA